MALACCAKIHTTSEAMYSRAKMFNECVYSRDLPRVTGNYNSATFVHCLVTSWITIGKNENLAILKEALEMAG